MLRKVVRHAWDRTLATLGGRPFFWTLLVLPTVGFCLHWMQAGRAAMIPELRTWLTYGLEAAGIVLVGLFLWNLVCAPYRIEKERRQVAEKRVLELEGLYANSAAQTAKRKALNILLGALMREGHEIISRERTSDPEKFGNDVSLWATRANALILAAFGEGESALFLNSSGYSFDGSRVSNRQNQHAAAFAQWRLRRLSELIPRMPALSINDDFDPALWLDRQEK